MQSESPPEVWTSNTQTLLGGLSPCQPLNKVCGNYSLSGESPAKPGEGAGRKDQEREKKSLPRLSGESPAKPGEGGDAKDPAPPGHTRLMTDLIKLGVPAWD